MERQGVIEVDAASVRRVCDLWRGDTYWLRLATNTRDFATIELAVQECEAAIRSDPPPRVASGGDLQRSLGQAPCPGGFVVEFGYVDWEADVWSLVNHFAKALERRGVSGTLSAGEYLHQVDVLRASEPAQPGRIPATRPPVPTLFVSFESSPTDRFAERRHWRVDPAQTREIVATVVAWADPSAGRAMLHPAGLSMWVDEGTDVRAEVQRVFDARRSVTLSVIADDGRHARHAEFGVDGQAVLQSIGDPGVAVADELRALAVELPQPMDVAFVRPAYRGLASFLSVDHPMPLPGLTEADIRYNKHLLAQYLPDAHGIQVVTDAHLERAHDLADWSVESLGHGRHLVTARDLEPWFAPHLPAPATLDRARTDWGAAIMSPEIAAGRYKRTGA